MPAPKKAEAKAPEAQEPKFPVIEAFAERATKDDVDSFFGDLKDGLAELKGPRADQAKKAKAAIARTEELLSHLLQVREKLEASQKPAAKGRK